MSQCENPDCQHRAEAGLWPIDPHHIIYKSQWEFRKEPWFDTWENKICLCRPCHDLVGTDRRLMVQILEKMKTVGTFRFEHPYEILCRKYKPEE